MTIIPYAIMWSGEKGEEEIRYCPYARQPAIHYKEDKGNGTPLYTVYHPQRSRRCVFEERCEVCGLSIDGPKVTISQADIIDGMIKTNEPLCCVSCVFLASTHCPEIKSQVEDKEILIREVLSYDISPHFNMEKVLFHLSPLIKQWRTRDMEWIARLVK